MKHNKSTMTKQFEVLYTRQKTQKTKTWHDGLVVIDNVKGINRISLYKTDENGCRGDVVESFSSHIQEINVSKIGFPSHLIQLVEKEEAKVKIGTDEAVTSSITNKTLQKSLEDHDDHIRSSVIKKNLVRPFKAPLLKVNVDIPKPVQVKASKKISKMISLNKISSKQGIVKAIEKIYTLCN
ncbi:ABC-transporter [Cryptosporidium ubiquitum]|uniref:ABC-transporter n=1 Tax=Cryptosporidium ubiquitum TaxID=857276 RepID=A0A1J4MM92_9CRYT|nr:ABC-transporter [Cryptosporidium ubiquitum]OII74579.1 ABC-transporter [Cryptosporidium ubiquitum]